MLSTAPPSGFRDFLEHEARRRFELIRSIAASYESFGFSPIETPTLENLDVLLGSGGGDENEKLIFKVLKRGDKLKSVLEEGADETQLADLGLRFDLTVPLSRLVSEYRDQIHLPWKVFHIAPVWRAERAQKGRFREFFQCDVDIVGSKSIAAEMEVIQAVAAALKASGTQELSLKLNDRRILKALAESSGFLKEKADAFCVLLDKRDKMKPDDLLSQVRDLLGAALSPSVEKIFTNTLSLSDVGVIAPEPLKELEKLLSALTRMKLGFASIEFDSSLARGLSYYTGPIFELRHASAGYSLGGGGRYDELIGRFSKQSIPAVGFSIGFERLLILLAEQAKITSNPVLFIPVFSEENRPFVLELASKCRRLMGVDVFADAAKLKTQLKYANDRGYRWVLFAGEDELKSNKYKLKDFREETETEYSESDLLEFLNTNFRKRGISC